MGGSHGHLSGTARGEPGSYESRIGRAVANTGPPC